MPTFKEPYEEAVDIGYRLSPINGLVERVRSVEVKPARCYALKLIANGVPIYYCGNAKGHARPLAGVDTSPHPSQWSIRPHWEGNNSANIYEGKYSDASVNGTSFAEE